MFSEMHCPADQLLKPQPPIPKAGIMASADSSALKNLLLPSNAVGDITITHFPDLAWRSTKTLRGSAQDASRQHSHPCQAPLHEHVRLPVEPLAESAA